MQAGRLRSSHDRTRAALMKRHIVHDCGTETKQRIAIIRQIPIIS
jgi:hypothetical protein